MPRNKRRLFPTDVSGLTRLASSSCPLCAGPNADFAFRLWTTQQRLFQGWCPACTNVWITSDALDEVKRRGAAHLLSAYLRRLPSEDWDTEVGMIAINELERLTSSIAELSVMDQFDLTLKLICEMCPVVGQSSRFTYQEDWPSLTAKSAETAAYIIFEMAKAGYLCCTIGTNPEIPPRPTWKAYERLQQIQSSGRNSHVGFVAMSFSPDQMPVWSQIIEPAIVDAGYKPIRVDRYEHNRRIDDEIIAQIRRCRFLVADFTEQKKGVYFEAGFALGLGRNVIWMCRESDKNDLHFDTRQFNHILYEDFDKAKRALTNRIVALEGPGNQSDK